jgi:hypothetical protein
VQGEEVLTSHPLRRKGGFAIPGQPLAGGCATRESRMVPRLLVFFSVDRCLVVQLANPRLASIRVGPCVQPLQGENYTYSRVLDHGQPYSSIALIR